MKQGQDSSSLGWAGADRERHKGNYSDDRNVQEFELGGGDTGVSTFLN